MPGEVIYFNTKARKKLDRSDPAAKPERNFVIIARADRGSTCLCARSVEDALAKADRLAELGEVSIIDPHDFEYGPDRFDDLLARWRET